MRERICVTLCTLCYDRLAAEYVGGALTRRYIHGPGVDEPVVQYNGAGLTDRRYLVTDHQGSVIAENGATTTRYMYGPYGEPNAWSGTRFRYTGQIALPDVSLYHCKARVYDPVLGRFLQTDPVGYEDDLNLYQYVGNDPLNLSDPSGEQAFDSLATRQIYEDEQDVLSGDMAIQEYNDRTAARAEGAATTLPVPAAGVACGAQESRRDSGRWLPAPIFERLSLPPIEQPIAAGDMLGCCATSAIKVTEVCEAAFVAGQTIRDHQEKIRNPAAHMRRENPNDPAAVRRARQDWREDIRRNREQNDVARDELRRRRLDQ